MTVQKEEAGGESREFLTMTVNGQLFGIPVLKVQDVLGEQRIMRIPLAPDAIMGSLNLRGRIVTAISLRRCLKIPALEKGVKYMSVVVEHKGELYSLIVDSVGEVLALPDEAYEKTPANLEKAWKEVSSGVYRLNESLLIVLDVAILFEKISPSQQEEAA